MKLRWLSLATAAFLSCLSFGAAAMSTVWEVKGHLTTVTGPFTGQFNVGDPFRILIGFDTNQPLAATVNGASSGVRYNYWSADSLTFRIEIGSACAPCEPARDPGFDPTQSLIIVRDNYDGDTPPPPQTRQALDGYTFGVVTPGGMFINVIMRGPTPLNVVNGPALAAPPDPRLASLATHALQACPIGGNSCDDAELSGTIESVSTPSFGTNYFLSARDCYWSDTTTNAALDSSPRDCIWVNSAGEARPTRGRFTDVGGELGVGDFSRTTSFTSDLTGPGAALGTVFGAITFSGPSGLPVLKASAFPTDIARLNSNLIGYQRYTYSGPPTSLPLVVDLGYGIADLSTDVGASPERGLRPGGASVSATLAIIDGSIPMPALASQINTLECGAESNLQLPDGTAWPAGSILGSAVFVTLGGENNPSASATLDVRSCSNPNAPVQLAANQSFIVATSIQTPARGKFSTGAQAAGNGYVDASHTMRVTFDPNAPPAVVQQLADNIAPQCTTCFTPEVVAVAVDVRPGSSDCINPKSNGVIPVAILGSPTFKVKDIRQDDSLMLGGLALRVRGGKSKCSNADVNADGYPDLVCNFDNVASNWSSGQTTASVTGKLNNGLPIRGSDAVCVK